MTFADDAILFAKQHRTEISRRLTDPTLFPPSESPVTVFMAGSPGAGKTEFSKNLLTILAQDGHHHPVRIDSDELRSEIPGYTGSNSSQVQGAASILLSEMYDRVLKNKQTAIVDGTFANYDKASENIRRSLKRSRAVTVFYLYQAPEVAWQFTLAREKVEGRNIPKDAFIDQFLRVRQTIERVHHDFGDTITIILVKKDYSTNAVSSQHMLRAQDGGLDAYLAKEYTREELAAHI